MIIESGMSPVRKRNRQGAQKKYSSRRSRLIFSVFVRLRAQRGALFDYEEGVSLTFKWFLPPRDLKVLFKLMDQESGGLSS
jgi:hypothetical protein